ncbi:MAG: four helix bundle protein [Candidatus Aminicenantes bacterium]|nr:MAG: four helix bundle protein [Candidatus Aminicenantes bacterium]
MPKSKNYKDLKCWHRAKDLAVDTYRLSMNGNLNQDFGLRDQLRKSAISVMSNIAEGKERGNPSEFVRFLNVAKASAAELRTQFIIAREVGYLAEGDFLDFEDKIIRISAMLGALIKSIRQGS